MDKMSVIAQIMLGEQCIENLVLGSLNATIQDQKALQNVDSGGAAAN